MSTLSEIVFSILDTVRPENLTNTSISTEIIEYHVKNTRAQLARQHISKYGTLSNQWFQPLGCVNIIETNESECCELPSGCVILRTDVPIPNTIEASTNLLKVGPVKITDKPFQNVEFERVPFEGTNRFTKSLVKWFVNNNTNYVYLLINKNNYIMNGIDTVDIQGVLEDPMEGASFSNCSTGVCYSNNSKYPIPDSLIPLLQEMVIKKIAVQAQAPVDSSNNNKTDLETTVSKGN